MADRRNPYQRAVQDSPGILDTLMSMLKGDPDEGLPEDQKKYNKKRKAEGISPVLDQQFSQDRPTLAAEGGNTMNDAVLGTRYSNSAMNPQELLQQQAQQFMQREGSNVSEGQAKGLLEEVPPTMFPDISAKAGATLPEVEDRSLPALADQEPAPVDDRSSKAGFMDRMRYEGDGNAAMGMLNSYNDWVQEDNRSEKLLRFGQGMLSEDEWYRGLGAGAGGIADVMQSERELAGRNTGNSSRRYRNMILRKADGSIQNVVHDRSLGTGAGAYLTPDGQPVDTSQGTLADLSDIDAGMPSTTDMTKRQRNIATHRNSLKQIDDAIDGYFDNDYEGGIKGATNVFSGMVDTLFGDGHLNAEEFWAMTQQGREQALIGAMREAVVGPGVMTENDAIRVMQALGQSSSGIAGVKRAMTNPNVAAQLLEEGRERTQALYDAEVGTYNLGANHPYLSAAYPKEEIYSRDSRIAEREDRNKGLADRRELIQGGGALSEDAVEITAENFKNLEPGTPVTYQGQSYTFAGLDDNGQPILE